MSLLIDPGHGGTDPGAVGNGIIEKDYNLEVSLYQYRRFKELGVPVKITRTLDKTIDSGPRARIVRESGMKHCISNHVNAGGGDGAEVIHSIFSNTQLPHMIAAELRNSGQNLRRVFSRKNNSGTDYYFMHRLTGSVETHIVEYGFLDSRGDDVTQLKRNQIAYAEAVVKAYCDYINKSYKSPGSIKEPVKDGADGVLPDGIYKPSDDFNEEVRTIQMYLNYFLTEDIAVDGYYGPATENAVSLFQKTRGITVDGIYGPKTRSELIEFYSEKMDKTEPVNTNLYRVQIGAYAKRENAENRLKAAKKYFNDAYISK